VEEIEAEPANVADFFDSVGLEGGRVRNVENNEKFGLENG
jgi:hypothetical protein